MTPLVFAAVLSAADAPSADPRWPHLSALHVDTSCNGEPVRILYDPKTSVVDGSEAPRPEPDVPKLVRGVRTRVAAGAPEIVVDYSEGGSCDPTFLVAPSAAARDSYEYAFDTFGLTLAIPGDGFLYVSGHTNSYFDRTKKFVPATKPGSFVEVPQPLYRAARATKALVDVELVAEPDSKTVVATLRAGDAATLELCRADDWCLAADRLGIVGWVKLVYSETGQFEGIRYAGD